MKKKKETSKLTLSKRLKKPKKIIKHHRLEVNIQPRNAPYIPIHMKSVVEEEKRSMFFD